MSTSPWWHLLRNLVILPLAISTGPGPGGAIWTPWPIGRVAGVIEILIRLGLALLSLMDLAEMIGLLRMVMVLGRILVRRCVVLNRPISVRHRPFPIALVARWTLVTHPVLPTPSVVPLKARRVPCRVLLWVP